MGAYKANALFIQKAKQHPNFKDTLFCVISFGDANAMIKELNEQTKNIIFSQVVPSYDDRFIEEAKEYRTLMKKYYPNEPLSFISFESFLAAKSVTQTIQNVKGSLTREKFLKAIKHLSPNFLEDITNEHQNSQHINNVYLFEYKQSKFIEISHEH